MYIKAYGQQLLARVHFLVKEISMFYKYVFSVEFYYSKQKCPIVGGVHHLACRYGVFVKFYCVLLNFTKISL